MTGMAFGQSISQTGSPAVNSAPTSAIAPTTSTITPLEAAIRAAIDAAANSPAPSTNASSRNNAPTINAPAVVSPSTDTTAPATTENTPNATPVFAPIVPIPPSAASSADSRFLSPDYIAHFTHANPLLADEPYRFHTFGSDMKAIKWDGIGMFAVITGLGLNAWKWGNTGFHFHSEKWFQKDRSSIGMDKLGHAYSSYLMTNLFAEHLQREGRPFDRSALSAALLTQALMLYVEAFDGFSTDHGFSYEDALSNVAGTTLGYLRQRYPDLKNLVDYRMQYYPSGFKPGWMKGFRPVSDYAGQKYLLVFKLSGIPALRSTPLKYLELNAGYYARGFNPQDIAANKPRTRTSFFGIGINLNELLFGRQHEDESLYTYAGRKFFEYVQLPTYAPIEKHSF